jgi:hypothetical protein
MKIDWPAFIKFFGDAELVYVPDQATWDSDPHLQGQNYHPDDLLIDADGKGFTLARIDGRLVPQPTATRFDLEEVLQMVRRHAAQDGACCVAKIGASSVVEAINLIR